MATEALSGPLESVSLDHLAEVEASARPGVHPLVGYVARRFALYLVTLWGAFTAAFLFLRLTPGDPINTMIQEMARQGQYSTGGSNEAMVAYYKKEFGLDGSLWDQYYRYMEQLILHLNFGPSIVAFPDPATNAVWRALPWTITLVGTATIIAWVIGVILGTFVGRARKSRFAGLITYFSLGLSNIPAYFVGLFLVIFLGYRYPIFPPNGAYDASLEKEFSWPFILSVIKYGTLPALSLVIVGFTGWLITTRALVINILGEDYLTYAEAKGLSPWRILNRYVLRNAWLPQIAALGIVLGAVVNGNILVERLYRYPGVGNLLIESITRKDVNTAQSIITLFIFGILTINLIIDLCLPLIDPRIKHIR
jgi:peptide/nickel transport system permease protein